MGLLSGLLFTTTLAGCSGTKEVTGPEWYETTPQDSSSIYGTASGVEQEKQAAVDRAMTGAEGDIARSLMSISRDALTGNPRSPQAARLKGMLPPHMVDFGDSRKRPGETMCKDFGSRQNQGAGGCAPENGDAAQLSGLSTILEDLTPDRQEAIQNDDGTWRAYVLVKVPIEDVARALSSE